MDNFPAEEGLKLLRWMINPITISTISMYAGLLGAGGRMLWKKLEKKQNEDLENIKKDVKELSDNVMDSMTTIERDMLRIQIVTGISSNRLSASEVTQLYDMYRDKKGNSYVTRMVDDYLEEMEHAEHD